MQLIDKIVIETLTVDSVAWSDAGFYECVAHKQSGSCCWKHNNKC